MHLSSSLRRLALCAARSRLANMCSAEPPLYTRGGKCNVADKMYTHLLQISNIRIFRNCPCCPPRTRDQFPPISENPNFQIFRPGTFETPHLCQAWYTRTSARIPFNVFEFANIQKLASLPPSCARGTLVNMAIFQY